MRFPIGFVVVPEPLEGGEAEFLEVGVPFEPGLVFLLVDGLFNVVAKGFDFVVFEFSREEEVEFSEDVMNELLLRKFCCLF